MFRFRQITIERFSHYVIQDIGGNIYNLKTGKLVKGWVNANGYRRIQLCNGKHKQCFYIHRLVALAFILNDDLTKDEVNHLDRIRYNCDVINLQWVTKQENLEYRWNGKKFYKKELSEEEIEYRKIINEFDTDFIDKIEEEIKNLPF